MKKLLEKLKLIQYFKSELTMSKEDFLEMMKEKIDQEKLGFLSDSLDPFSKHKNKFKGTFDSDKIVFKHRATMFNNVASIPEATVTFSETNKRLTITTKIKGLKGPLLIMLIFALIGIPSTLLFAIRMSGLGEVNQYNIIVMTAFIIVPIVMVIVVYTVTRIIISGLKKRIEAELYDMEW